MKAKRKLIITILITSFVMLSVVATVAIAFALTQQTIKSSINIGYKVDGIDGTATATFSIAGGQPEYLNPSADAEHISEDGRSLVFKAGDKENAGTLLFPEDGLDLTAQEYYVDIHYTYTNTGVKHYIASMDFAANIVAENMLVEYSTDGVEYSEQRYALAVPAKENGVPGQRDYWIRISIENRAKSASFEGEFDWLLYACDPQDEAYLSIPSFEFQATGTDGEYQVALDNTGTFGTRLVVPSSVNGDEVTTIAESTLTPEQKAMVTSVYIPESVTTIGENAFNGFTNLETVTLEQYLDEGGISAQSSAGLQTVGANAFKDCTSLTQLIIPNTIISYNSTALTGCVNLNNITLDTMDASALTAVKTLASANRKMNVIIGNKVTSISFGAFKDHEGVTSVVIGDNVTEIGGDAFNRCGLLENVTLGKGIKSIPGYAFQSTKISNIEIPEGITSIGSYAFAKCANLTEIVMPNNVKSIGAFAFSECTSLSGVKIGSGVTNIANEAFNKCSALEEITIPAGVTTISASAFIHCTGLQKVITPDVNKWAAINFGSAYANPLMYAKNLYLTSDLNNPITSINLSNITSIGSYAFNNCQTLTEITIPASVTSVGKDAFKDCTGINKVITADINKWASLTFNNEYSNPIIYAKDLYLSSDLNNPITTINLSNTVTEIGNYAFRRCGNLQTVTLPSSVTSIGNYAFAGCGNLNSLTIESGVTSIGEYAFSSCTFLNTVTLPDSVKTIGAYAFSYCEFFNTLNMSNNIETVGEYAFAGNIYLTAITIPNSIKSFASTALSGCNRITTINLDTMNEGALAAIKSLELTDTYAMPYLTIGGTITYISYGAFENWNTGIFNVVILSGITEIGVSAFAHSSIHNVSIPDSVKTIHSAAFYGTDANIAFDTVGEWRASNGHSYYEAPIIDFSDWQSYEYGFTWRRGVW